MLVGPKEKDMKELEVVLGQIPHTINATVVLVVVDGEGVDLTLLFQDIVNRHKLRLDITVAPIEFRFPPGFDPANMRAHVKWSKRGKWNYQHMIRFWFSNFFLLPFFRNVEYVMRLDTDVELPSDFWKTPDFFQLMQDSHCSQGYINVMSDDPIMTQGLVAFVEDYAHNHSLTLKRSLTMPGSADNVKIFFNNVEVVHLPSFRESSIQEFITTVDQSFNIYLRRWGDAPLRFALAALFFNESQICHYQRPYVHAGTTIYPVSMEEASARKSPWWVEAVVLVAVIVSVILEKRLRGDCDMVAYLANKDSSTNMIMV